MASDWGWLGVAIQNVTPAIAKSLGLDPNHPTGALVASVTPDSPAAQAGIKQGDVITAAGGHDIKAVHDLPRLVAATPVGSKLELTIVRDGKQETVEATIGESRRTWLLQNARLRSRAAAKDRQRTRHGAPPARSAAAQGIEGAKGSERGGRRPGRKRQPGG